MVFGRRSFLGASLAALGAALLFPVRGLQAAAKKLGIGLDKAPDLKSVGGSAILKVKGRDILFVRDSETTVKAFDPICSHKKCQVGYKKDSNRIECECHGSKFTLDGVVLNGPATVNLTTLPATLDAANGRIIVTVEE
jgi:Rieske Fe-S protein